MSSRELTHIEIDFLAKGLNFFINFKAPPNKDIATIEDAVKDPEKEHFKIPNFLNMCKALNDLQSGMSVHVWII